MSGRILMSATVCVALFTAVEQTRGVEPKPPLLKERVTLKGHTEPVWSVAFSPDGKTLASGDGTEFRAGEIKLWDAASGQERASLKGHTERVASLCFSPDGKILASADLDKTIKLWDVRTGQERK
jgi:WD40 repeat protein